MHGRLVYAAVIFRPVKPSMATADRHTSTLVGQHSRTRTQTNTQTCIFLSGICDLHVALSTSFCALKSDPTKAAQGAPRVSDSCCSDGVRAPVLSAETGRHPFEGCSGSLNQIFSSQDESSEKERYRQRNQPYSHGRDAACGPTASPPRTHSTIFIDSAWSTHETHALAGAGMHTRTHPESSREARLRP